MIDLIYHLFDSCVHPCILQTFYLIIQELAHEMHYLIPVGLFTDKNKHRDYGYQMHFSLFLIFENNNLIKSTFNDLIFLNFGTIQKGTAKEKNQQNPTT